MFFHIMSRRTEGYHNKSALYMTQLTYTANVMALFLIKGYNALKGSLERPNSVKRAIPGPPVHIIRPHFSTLKGQFTPKSKIGLL